MGKPMIKGAVCLAGAGLALQMAARLAPGFGDWYANHVYPLLVGTVGRLCGLAPCSVSEIGLYVLGIGLVILAVRNRRHQGKTAAVLLWTVSLLFFLYTACCGVNYYRRPFSETGGFEVRESSLEELESLCVCLTEEVCRAAEGRETGEAEGQWFRDVDQKAAAAMRKLGDRYPDLAGFYPRPKALMVSEILSVQQLSGIYSPFTVEANYNGDMTAYNLPHTACHELSHLRGFMREDEANFIGFLACIGSDDADVRYSGYLTGWIYAGNALAARDFKAYSELYFQLPESVQKDLMDNMIFWEGYDGVVAEAANRVNDTYLKINDQEDGVESYGRVVDLMLAYYREDVF